MFGCFVPLIGFAVSFKARVSESCWFAASIQRMIWSHILGQGRYPTDLGSTWHRIGQTKQIVHCELMPDMERPVGLAFIHHSNQHATSGEVGHRFDTIKNAWLPGSAPWTSDLWSDSRHRCLKGNTNSNRVSASVGPCRQQCVRSWIVVTRRKIRRWSQLPSMGSTNTHWIAGNPLYVVNSIRTHYAERPGL